MAINRIYPHCWIPFVLCLLVVLFAGTADAANFSISTTDTTGKTLTTNETGTIASGGRLSVSGNTQAITVTGTSGTVTLNNSGTVTQTGTARAIRNNTQGVTLNFNNSVGAEISAVGDDVLKVGSGSIINLDNQGTIWQKGIALTSGQALDLRDMTSSGNTIINGSATNTTALIRADNDDAIRPGKNTTLTNYGTIISYGTVNTKFPDYLGSSNNAPSAQDGIDIGAGTGVVINNYGTISGPRHGITADTELTVTNYAGGNIIGRNGSGVGSDGTGTVTNYGTISGQYAGAGNAFEQAGYVSGSIPPTAPSSTTVNNGDGDGVDIDGIGTVNNYGTIQGTGAGGYDSGGNPNGAEGIAMGGGTVNNYAGGVIYGLRNGILVDDGADGSAGNSATPGRGTATTPGGAVSILNEGTITGMTGYAIRLAGNFNDTLINTGTINGKVDMGDGIDSMIVRGAADISTIPILDGGAGSNDTLTFDAWAGKPGTSIINWEKINLTNATTVDLPNATDSSNPVTIAFTTLTIDSTSTLLADGESPGYYTLVGDVLNRGTISLSDNFDAEDLLAITGNYTGDSGTIKLDINASTVASDKVAISGTATGTTNVVLNTIGDGRVITPSSPITLITVGNAAASDAHAFSFSLASPNIGAGVYDPQISYANGVYSFASYLLSHYREEAALLQAITSSVERLDFESVTGFHECHAYNKLACGADVQSPALWVRGYGSSFRLDQKGDAATSIKGYSFGTQFGADLSTGHSGRSSEYHMGIFAGKGYQKTDVNGIRTDKAGEISQQIFTMGMYGSIERPGCFYLEGVLQAGYHDLEIKSPDEPASLDKHLWSMVASVETGVTVPLTTSIDIEPKVQAIYQHTGSMGLATRMGTVTIRDHDGLRTRLGATSTFKKTALPFNPFLEVELIRDFSNDCKSYYSESGKTLSSNPEATHVGGAIGIASVNSGKKSLACYVKAGALYGVDGDGSYDYIFTAGLTRSF